MAVISRRERQLANAISAIPLPESAQPATARDGSVTYIFPDKPASQRYLGRSSMPRVRAEALVDALCPDGSNILLPQMGTGHEAHEILRRTGDRCAVFVHEPDRLCIRLALSLHDFSRPLRMGRLILLNHPDIVEALQEFFSRNPGYEFPQKILTPPDMDTARTESLRKTVTQAARHVTAQQHQELQTHSQSLARRRSKPKIKAIAILSMDPRPTAADACAALQRAAAQTGIDVAACVPNHPNQCHHVARMKTLVDSSADAAILLNGGWGPMLPFVHNNLPSATWMLPGSRMIAGMTDGFATQHVIFVATPFLKDETTASVGPDRSTQWLEPAVDETTFQPSHDPASTVAKPIDVICLGHHGDIQPDTHGIKLESHIAFWNELIAQARVADDDEDAIIAAAQRSTGIEITEPDLLEQFRRLLRHVILPTIRTTTALECLVRAGRELHVYGDGWNRNPLRGITSHLLPPTAANRNQLFNAAKIVVVPLHATDVVQNVLEALAAGSCVVIRRPRSPLDESHPQLADVLQRLPAARTNVELAQRVSDLLADDTRRRSACSSAREILLQRHTWSHRLTAIRQALAQFAATA